MMRMLIIGLVATFALVQGRSSEFFCYQCEDASDNSECHAVSSCPDKDTCLTQVLYSEDGIAIQKRCSKVQMCYNYEENNEDGCSNPDEEFEGICSYCCDSPGCNKGLPPYGTEKHREKRDGSSSGGGLGHLLNLASFLKVFNNNKATTQAPKSGGKSAPKPHAGSGAKTPQAGGKTPHPKPGAKTPQAGGKTPHPKPGAKAPGPGGKTPHAQPGAKTPGPGGKTPLKHSAAKTPQKTGSGGLALPTNPPKPAVTAQPKVTAPPATNPPATNPPATNPPATNPPATNAPVTNAPATNPPATNAPATNPPATNSPSIVVNPGNNGVPSCHCHAGQPCYANHANTGQAVNAAGGPGIDVNIHINLGSLLGLQAATCPCANQKPVVSVNQLTAQPTVKPPVPQTSPTQPPTQPATAKPQTTQPPTTQLPTQPATAKPQTTQPPTTQAPTQAPTTQAPTTQAPTQAPTTQAPTTQAPTTQAPTTQAPTTQTTTTPPTTVKPTYCYTCKDKTCQDTSLTACPSDQYYCMNTISQSNTGDRVFTKECVLEQTCSDKWWIGTAGRPDCFLLDDSPSGPPGMPLDKCSFCCQDDGCNKDALPNASTLYNPKNGLQNSSPSSKLSTSAKPPVPQTHPTTPQPTTSQPTTPQPTTPQPTTPQPKSTATKKDLKPMNIPPPTKQPSSSQPSTAAAKPHESKPMNIPIPKNPPSNPATTAQQTTAASKPPGISCAVCGDYDKQVPCNAIQVLTAPLQTCPPYHFCMNDVVYDDVGTQYVYKRCASQMQCMRQWYEETSDRAECTKMNFNNPPLKTTCHFCCKSNGCNTNIIPGRSTFYIPKH